MDALIAETSAMFTEPLFWALCAIGVLTGIVRGFAGFGTGMILVPASSALFQPKIAVIIVWVVDSLPALPILLMSIRNVHWPTVLPVGLGFALTVMGGTYILVHTDVNILRWGISILVGLCVLLLVSGWRYTGKRSHILSTFVGGISGITGGAASLPVPAVLAYWRALSQPALVTRANMISFMFITEMIAGLAYYSAGLFTAEAIAAGIGVAPFYLLGTLIGQKGFHRADEKFYWRVAICIISLSALFGLPVFDSIWR